jgi:acyl-CoA thioesterase-2
MNLPDVLTLERRGEDVFFGYSPDQTWKRVYGGLVVAQSLLAAYATIEGRVCHSLHSYFLRPGDPRQPVEYAVERTRDGASFAVRRVTASQAGKRIFDMTCSFQTPETGVEHQFPMPQVDPPEALQEETQRWLELGDIVPESARRFAASPQRIDARWIGPATFARGKAEPHKAVWMRAKAPVGATEALHQATLAYASDMTFVETALRPHGLNYWSEGLQTTSLDHALWFHHPVDFNQWHLFVQDSPVSSGGRGLVRGYLFSRDGLLVASAAQEGLIRRR